MFCVNHGRFNPLSKRQNIPLKRKEERRKTTSKGIIIIHRLNPQKDHNLSPHPLPLFTIINHHRTISSFLLPIHQNRNTTKQHRNLNGTLDGRRSSQCGHRSRTNSHGGSGTRGRRRFDARREGDAVRGTGPGESRTLGRRVRVGLCFCVGGVEDAVNYHDRICQFQVSSLIRGQGGCQG